jgi:MSHA biogenesis protein MshE
MSTIPAQFGESAVLRLLTHGTQTGVNDLYMPVEKLDRFRKLIHRPHGLILVTGPTGSGKTTTLYAALADLNTPERKILTVEDPVEYSLAGANQIQVNDKIDLTFARALRAFLRQDPDVILLGEMRDAETAQIALRAALTGHLVLSTLHTNDAPSAAARLMDMGAPPFLLATSLAGVVAQRLVRKLCPVCASPAELEPTEREWMRDAINHGFDVSTAMTGKGCGHCHHTGYQGRIGIYELLEIDGELASLLNAGNTSAFRTLANTRLQGKTLRDEAVQLVREGKTSVAEAMRVTHQVDE